MAVSYLEGEAFAGDVHATLYTMMLGLGFFVLLTTVYLTQISGAPVFLTGWRMALLFLVFGVLAMGAHVLEQDDDVHVGTLAVVLVIALVLFETIFRAGTASFGLGVNHVLELGVILVLLLGYLVVYPDPRDLRGRELVAVGLLSAVIAIVFYHLTTQSPRVPTRWPLWAAVVAGINLLVIPRFVPERVVLWSFAGLAAIATLFALPAVIVGEYTVLRFEVHTSAQTLPLTATPRPLVPAIASVFNNVNVFGLVAFAGVAAGVILLHRAVVHERRPSAVLAGGVFLLNGVGLALSNSGVAWIAAATTLAIYVAYLLAGRGALPLVLVAGAIGAAAVIWLGYMEIIPVDDSRRFDRWRSGIEAFRASPTLLGEGHVSSVELTAPYVEGSPGTPHNGYLEILLRFGGIGLLAYSLFVFGAIAWGAIDFSRVNVGMLALATGWAVHHLFESYTFFHWTIAAVLSSLAFGYLLFGDTPDHAERGT